MGGGGVDYGGLVGDLICGQEHLPERQGSTKEPQD